jgi:methionyl-tRNA formyltransferase
MILQTETSISKNETAGELHDRLMKIGSNTVLESLELIEKDNTKPQQQDNNLITKTAYKLNKDNCKIDWNKSGLEIHNHIRGLSPYPASWCTLKDEENEWNIKIYEAIFLEEKHDLEIGRILTTKKELKIAVQNGMLLVKVLQFPGKKKMTTQELLNGVQLSQKARVI